MAFQWKREIQLAAKWARITYDDRTEIGSGLDLIQGSTKTDVTIQILYKMP